MDATRRRARYVVLVQQQAEMIDRLLTSRALLAHYRGSEIHNELLHDESVAFGTDVEFPDSDHAPVNLWSTSARPLGAHLVHGRHRVAPRNRERGD